ncbi:MAG: nuclear transport factor 2 family protein [Gammaproteobacteria bacterium]|jgi:hypothetical protein|nr:nuclear transport factor 2 family protein [Gammaproteobacteria bacterium]
MKHENLTPEEMAHHIHLAWNTAWGNNDVDGLLALYSENVVLESPLIPYLLGKATGICEGKKELRELLVIAAARKPACRHYFKKNFFTNGKTIIWEYPRLSPEGEQMDFIEVLELEGELISKHRVYWGWFGFNILKKDAYYR